MTCQYKFYLFSESMPNSACLSAHRGLILNVDSTRADVISAESIENADTDILDNQCESITVSRPPPWRRHSVYAHVPPATDVSSINKTTPSHTSNHIPPVPQQQWQTSWRDDMSIQKIPIKRPNFEEDPTGYLGTTIINITVILMGKKSHA